MALTLEDKKTLFIDALKATYKVQYDAVQPLPYIKDRQYCVDKVFVEVGVEANVAPEATRGAEGSWERLESYKSIYTDFRLRSKRRIIEGEPGYGKSTLTLQLAYDWCNGVQDSPLCDVEILILLRLRQLGGIKSIYRAIKIFLLSKSRLRTQDIKEIIQSCSSVNIILDGYDEYPGRDIGTEDEVNMITMMEMFEDFDVTLTTRYLPRHFSETTKRAKLTGFDDKARDEYIRKAVVGDDDEAVEQIKQRLQENGVLADLCQVPLIFVMFAHMTHEYPNFQKYNSVTSFFRYMISCFHKHLKIKSKDANFNVLDLYANDHAELDKIAFEGLSKENQQLTWDKNELHERLGRAFYDQYIKIGILVEEEVASDTEMEENKWFITKVRFYHKLFCEWYGAHYLASYASRSDVVFKQHNSSRSPAQACSFESDLLNKLNPFDLQYLFRFACGLRHGAGKKIIEYLKSSPGGDKFAILCILEQTGDVDDIMDTIRELCSSKVIISENDSSLLQRSTIQLLEIASSNEIPISDLLLQWSFSKVDTSGIVLKSSLCLPSLSSLEKIQINVGLGGELSEEDVIGLLNYGLQSKIFRELWFLNCTLPASFRPEILPKTSKSRTVKVMWPSHASQLDLQSGQWKKADDIQTIRELCSGVVSIDNDTSELVQQSVIELLKKASIHDIPIYCVTLVQSFNKADKDNIYMMSGLSLPILSPLERMQIQTEEGREINIQEVNGILNYLQQSQGLKQLVFGDCLLPFFLSGASLSIFKSRNAKVFWLPYGDGKREYRLDLQYGHWLLGKDSASLFPMRAIGDILTSADYATEVRSFREDFRHYEWQQKNSVLSTGK